MSVFRQQISGVDLFCGIGGLTYGLASGDVGIVAGIDIDHDCGYAFSSNNQAKFIGQDVKTVTGEQLAALWPRGTFRLLAGCAPCQSFSSYSRQARKIRFDEKWALVLEFARLVEETKPDLVTMENVPHVLTHPVFLQFLSSLVDYHVFSKVVDCTSFGVPQTRKRLVVIASRLGPIDLSAARGPDVSVNTVRNAIGNLPPLQAGECDVADGLHRASSLSELNLRRIRASSPGGTWREWDSDLLADCHRRKSGATYPAVYGRMEWDRPSPTITTQFFGYGNGRFGHPDQDRAISLREAALLQTFPQDYQFVKPGEPLRFSTVGRWIGNAVPVRLGEAIAQTLVNHVRLASPKP